MTYTISRSPAARGPVQRSERSPAPDLARGVMLLFIALGNATSMWDGVVRAAHLYDDSTLQPNLIVFSDGEDTQSVATAEQAQAAAESVGATVFAVGVENAGFDELATVAANTGGASAIADDASGVGALFEDVQQTLR